MTSSEAPQSGLAGKRWPGEPFPSLGSAQSGQVPKGGVFPTSVTGSGFPVSVEEDKVRLKVPQIRT